MQPLEKTVKIVNKRGLHARAAAKFVKLAETHKADIRVLKDDMDVCGTSIMGLLMLSASQNTAVVIRVSGEGADAALSELSGLIERRFDEDE
ncbi:MAG: HPr family phosphocarrier protein [Alphaproteobacteria bacterium]